LSDNLTYPRVNSKEFKELDFRTQLWLFNLLLHDRDKYSSLTGEVVVDEDLLYVDDSINFILSQERCGNPELDEDSLPIVYYHNHWAAYQSFYKSTWYEEGFSPLDEFDIQHRRIFSLQLFSFPFLAIDRQAFRILRWLLKDSGLTDFRDLLFDLVKLRAAREYFEKESKKIVDVWNASIVALGDYCTVPELNLDYPVIDIEEEPLYSIETEELVLLHTMPRFARKSGADSAPYAYVPLVPSELYNRSQFYVKSWDLLV